MLNGFDYPHWLAAARRASRKPDDAPDLLHDSLIEAIRANRTDFSNEQTRRWFTGVLKNRARMDARSASRRKSREQGRSPRITEIASPPDSFIENLPRSARAVATLALSGMTREEIVSALDLSSTAFRQRLSTIRRAWERLPPDQRGSIFEDAVHHPRPDPNFNLGLIRRALLTAVRFSRGFGMHDPDGHLIVIERKSASQSPPPRQRGNSSRR